jgi:hypothetical protein
MPRVALIDVYGMEYRCDTRDPDRLKAWLAEWLPRLAHPDCPTQMTVWPLPNDDDTWDWPTGPVNVFRRFPVPSDPLQAYIAMEVERRRLQRELAERSPKP